MVPETGSGSTARIGENQEADEKDERRVKVNNIATTYSLVQTEARTTQWFGHNAEKNPGQPRGAPTGGCPMLAGV